MILDNRLLFKTVVTFVIGEWFDESGKCEGTFEIFNNFFNHDFVIGGFSFAFFVSGSRGMRAVGGEPCGFFGEGYVLRWVEGIVDYTLEALVIVVGGISVKGLISSEFQLYKFI